MAGDGRVEPDHMGRPSTSRFRRDSKDVDSEAKPCHDAHRWSGLPMSTLQDLRGRRRMRLRFQLRQKSSGRPRLSVFRSGRHIYAQVIDDGGGRTLAAASSLDKTLRDSLRTGADKSAASAVGKLLAERALAAGVKEVVFDRGAYLYHGRVKALADAAREGGLAF
jgi:large subunit ribosomal protein L18